jgi:hypothetical protein
VATAVFVIVSLGDDVVSDVGILGHADEDTAVGRDAVAPTRSEKHCRG